MTIDIALYGQGTFGHRIDLGILKRNIAFAQIAVVGEEIDFFQMELLFVGQRSRQENFVFQNDLPGSLCVRRFGNVGVVLVAAGNGHQAGCSEIKCFFHILSVFKISF